MESTDTRLTLVRIMERLPSALTVTGVVWLVVCQALLSLVLLRTGRVWDPCDRVELAPFDGWSNVLGVFGLWGGVAFGVLPCVVIFAAIAGVAKCKKRPGLAVQSIRIAGIGTALLIMGLGRWFQLAPQVGVAPVRVLLVGFMDIVFVRAARKAQWGNPPAS